MNAVHCSMSVPVNADPEAMLSLGTVSSPILPGQSFTYDLHIGQIGSAPLSNTSLTLELPPGLTVDDVSDGGTADGEGTITWDLGTIGVAASAYRSATVSVSGDLPAATVLKARSWLSFDGGDQVDVQAEYTAATSQLPLALTAEWDMDGATATPGERTLYSTTVTNTSARAVENIRVMLRVPRGLQYSYSADANPNSSNCGGNCVEGEENYFTIDSLGSGLSETLTINALVQNTVPAGTLIPMTQRVSADGLGAEIFIKKTLVAVP